MITSTDTSSFHSKHPPDQPVIEIDGFDLKLMLGAGFGCLKQHSHIVDALNVFPVPDGDTGTNMVLTMQSAWEEVSAHGGHHSGEMLQAFAGGAVRGARGNSGVILSQILRGLAEQQREGPTLDAEQFANAMQQGKETAYKGVMKPVEGTILTVIREAADAAGHAAAINPDLRFVLDTTLAKAKQALDNTPNLLPVLKQAGVVDAGGQGLCYILEGMSMCLHGEPMLQPEQVSAETMSVPLPQPDLKAFVQDEWGFDIQYLVYGEHLDEDAIREQLLVMGGDSVVVGSVGTVVKVHVHHEDPGPFLSYGASLGHLDDIVLENMTLQTLRRKGEWDENAPDSIALLTPDTGAGSTPFRDCSAVVAVASGEGLVKVLESFGVCAIVTGGQTMNPSTEELLQAANSLPHEDVILLPNNKNIILAARQAAALATKRIHVIETHSVPQGIAAMLGFNADASAEKNLAAMSTSCQGIYTAEITTAVRDASIDDIECFVGDMIGLIDGKLCCTSDAVNDIVKEVLSQLDPDQDAEILTLYYGGSVTSEEAQILANELTTEFPEHEIELVYGGQPHYHYLIAVE